MKYTLVCFEFHKSFQSMHDWWSRLLLPLESDSLLSIVGSVVNRCCTQVNRYLWYWCNNLNLRTSPTFSPFDNLMSIICKVLQYGNETIDQNWVNKDNILSLVLGCHRPVIFVNKTLLVMFRLHCSVAFRETRFFLSVTEFRDCFSLFARSGKIRNVDELSVIMRSLRTSPTITELKAYLKNKNGQLSFADFLEVMHIHSQKEKSDKEIRAAFKASDPNKKGTMPVKELRHILQGWGEKLSAKEGKCVIFPIRFNLN